jgi:hypothetical protein
VVQQFLEVTFECRLGGLKPAIDAHFVGADLEKKKRSSIQDRRQGLRSSGVLETQAVPRKPEPTLDTA